MAPGGSYEKALVAASYGAEEVYIGVPYTSLRMRQNKVKNFDILKKTIEGIHNYWSKALLTMNIFPRNTDIKIFEEVVEKVSDSSADAIIFSDPGTFQTLKKYFPNTPFHLSTQTSTLNYAAVQFRYDLWVKRIVCARELNIKEIKEIKEKVPGMELEVFVHGAMCMSYSWRCLLGDYMSGRQANKGECSHACRFKYKVRLEEDRRPWKLFQLDGDEWWSYILSSKDLCVIDKLEKIMPYVDALKIEWRSKSEFYVWSVVKAYKHVRDAIIEWNGTRNKIQDDLKNLVEAIPHRPYWDGFLLNELKDFPEIETCHPEPVEGNLESKNISTTAKAEYTSSMWQNLDSPGPIFDRNYFGLFKPGFIEKDNKKYQEFTPKEVIEIGMKIKFLSPKWMGELEILDILKEGGQSIVKATCNTPKVYILTDQDLKWWEVLYK